MGKAFRALISLGTAFKMLKVVTGPLRTNAYLIQSMKTSEALLVDSPPGVWKVLQPLIKDGLKLKWVLLTHGHFDHAAEAKLVRDRTGASVIMHPADRELFSLSQNVARSFGVEWVDPEITKYAMDDEVLTLMNELRIRVLHTPGHTPGSLTYYIMGHFIAFTGDTLFKGVVGATHFPGGSDKEMTRSLRKIYRTLPLETVIYPGHGEETTLKSELLSNEYVKRAVLNEKGECRV